jgi:transposase
VTIFQRLAVPGGPAVTPGGRGHVHSFTRGLDLDIQAATAALTLPHHNGRTEGVNTKTKMIKRQMYGRAGFTLLRHRIEDVFGVTLSDADIRDIDQKRKTTRFMHLPRELAGDVPEISHALKR